MTQDEVAARAARPRHRDPHQRRGPGRRQVPPVARHDHQARRRPTGSACASTPATSRGDDDQPVLRQPRRQADRVGQGPPDRRSPARSARSRRWSSRASPPPSRPTSRSSATPTSRRSKHSTKWVEETLDLSGIGAPKPPPASADDDASRWSQRTHHRRGQRQALRRQDVGARSPAGRGRRRRRGAKKPRAARGGGGGGGRRQRRRRGADAGHDRQGARRGRPDRSRSARASSCSRR